MAQLAWEKTPEKPKNGAPKRGAQPERLKFLIGGGLLLAVVLYLVFSGTMVGARFFISVNEVASQPEYLGQTVRITGAVLGESIRYDRASGQLEFTIAHINEPFTDLALALNQAVNDPSRTRLAVSMANQVMPDLLQNEAQAILTGKMGADGIFYATELNLKCPSRFGEEQPDGIAANTLNALPNHNAASSAKD